MRAGPCAPKSKPDGGTILRERLCVNEKQNFEENWLRAKRTAPGRAEKIRISLTFQLNIERMPRKETHGVRCETLGCAQPGCGSAYKTERLHRFICHEE